LNASNGIFSWRPLLSQAKTTNLIVVKVANNGAPNLSATNSFAVTVNPLSPPNLGSITASGGQVRLLINGPLGPDYTLLTSTNLTDWQVLFTTNSPVPPVTLMDTNLNGDAVAILSRPTRAMTPARSPDRTMNSLRKIITRPETAKSRRKNQRIIYSPKPMKALAS
jgi:hypothetical protein